MGRRGQVLSFPLYLVPKLRAGNEKRIADILVCGRVSEEFQ